MMNFFLLIFFIKKNPLCSLNCNEVSAIFLQAAGSQFVSDSFEASNSKAASFRVANFEASSFEEASFEAASF